MDGTRTQGATVTTDEFLSAVRGRLLRYADAPHGSWVRERLLAEVRALRSELAAHVGEAAATSAELDAFAEAGRTLVARRLDLEHISREGAQRKA